MPRYTGFNNNNNVPIEKDEFCEDTDYNPAELLKDDPSSLVTLPE